jgi:hypothetical protein
MTSKELEAIFSAHSVKRGHALILDERWTLALIDAAQENDVAVAGIELHRPAEDGVRSGRAGHTLGLAVDRSESWGQAREFVSYLTGKGAAFEVLLEAPQYTHGARLRDGKSGLINFPFANIITFVLVVAVIFFLLRLGPG